MLNEREQKGIIHYRLKIQSPRIFSIRRYATLANIINHGLSIFFSRSRQEIKCKKSVFKYFFVVTLVSS
jgi:hypothetical protein